MDLKRVDRLVARSVFGDRKGKLLRYEKLETPSSVVFCLEYAIDGASEVLFVKCPAEGSTNRTTQRLAQLMRDDVTFVPEGQASTKALEYAATRTPRPHPSSVGVVDDVGVVVLSKK